MGKLDNLFANIPLQTLPEELVETLVSGKSFQLKKIISTGQTAPTSGWYDKATEEWVIVLKGSAIIVFEKENREVKLTVGDWMIIPAHTRHRVSWTDPDNPTVWLALHFETN